MRFRITRHSGYAAPADALVLLMRRLGARRGEVSFAMFGKEIRALWGEDEGSLESREGKAEEGRWAVFEIVRDTCEEAPELNADWYAVSHVA